MAAGAAIGFIGLGVMGEPICRHLGQKSGRALIAFDTAAAPLDRLPRDRRLVRPDHYHAHTLSGRSAGSPPGVASSCSIVSHG